MDCPEIVRAFVLEAWSALRRVDLHLRSYLQSHIQSDISRGGPPSLVNVLGRLHSDEGCGNLRIIGEHPRPDSCIEPLNLPLALPN